MGSGPAGVEGGAQTPSFAALVIIHEDGRTQLTESVPSIVHDLYEQRCMQLLYAQPRTALLLGRKTYERIWKKADDTGIILEGITKIILTRQKKFAHQRNDEVHIRSSIDAAIELCDDLGLSTVYILGGATLVKDALASEYCTGMHLTLTGSGNQLGENKKGNNNKIQRAHFICLETVLTYFTVSRFNTPTWVGGGVKLQHIDLTRRGMLPLPTPRC